MWISWRNLSVWGWILTKRNLTEYLNEEIPDLKGKSGFRWLFALFKARMLKPSYDAIYMIRFCDVNGRSQGLKKLLRIFYKLKLVRKYGIYFNARSGSRIGKGLFLPHPSSIVFGAGINIGEHCTIYQNVTLGAKRVGSFETDDLAYPQIGDNCVLYAGAVVVGPVFVKNGTQVGANAVLLTDTEENSVYAGVPAVKKG